MLRELPAPTRRAVLALIASAGVLYFTLGWARYASFHNETFDLAFYARLAWGIAHQDHWEPMVNAHMYGLHLSPVLLPIGLLGRVVGTVFVLLATQSTLLALSAVPLADMGMRRFGPDGAIVAAIAWLLYPNLGHVTGYEAHPGTMAALPLAWCAWAIDRGSLRGLALASVGTLMFREDLALGVAVACVLYAWLHRDHAKRALAIAGGCAAYLAFFLFYLHPTYAPASGSLELHFARFGATIPEIATYPLRHPLDFAAYLATPARLAYVPKILAPLALLPLLRARWLIPALPVLAVNLISEWPTATDLDVHYLTPAAPWLVAGAIDGAARIDETYRRPALVALVVGAVASHVIAGGTPFSIDYDRAAFVPDPNRQPADRIVERIGPDASVQAPYAILPHVAERRSLQRTSHPESNADFYVLDLSHRRRFAGREDVLRTVEEPRARAWIARDDHAVVMVAGDYALLERGVDPRHGVGTDAIVGRADPDAGQPLCACLAILGARLEGERLTLDLVARSACPSDLAIRIGTRNRPRHADLIAGGVLSPAHFRRGDRIESPHVLSPDERDSILQSGLRVGAVRQSGARPEPTDPDSVRVPLVR
ncbi:MAG: DUF2079 domain-containing protein [Sandaracinaceae bacterium]